MDPAITVAIEEQALKVRSLVHAKVPPDDFLDVMQDIRLAFLIALPKYAGNNGAKLETYAQGIARYRIADYWRRAYRRKELAAALIENYKNPPEISVVQDPKNPPEANLIPGAKDSGIQFMTATEKEVFRLIGTGLSNEEIAQRRFTSMDTIRSHIKAIYKKLRCRNRVKVALLAQRIFKEET